MSAEAIDCLSRDEIEARLSAGAEARAALIRAGAEAGVAEAQAVYGQMLLDGGGVKRDAAEALRWFRRAAAQQHLMALNMVGRCYELGWGTPVDKAKAADCYRVAAKRGLDWAMYNYATLLTLGEGVAEDKAAASTRMAGSSPAIWTAPPTAIAAPPRAATSAASSTMPAC